MYFDLIYNPIYDRSTATLNRYHLLQAHCLAALELPSARRLLCIGLGTGHEAVSALRLAPRLSVAGIDFSPAALKRSERKLRKAGKTAELQLMDARALSYPDETFDRAVCVHVLDFIVEAEAVVFGIVRVLTSGGRFVLTLPSRVEGAVLGLALVRDQVRLALRHGRDSVSVLLEIVSKLFLGLLYLPLMLRSGRRSFTRDQVRKIFSPLPVTGLTIEEESTYQDFIISGWKRSN